MQDADLVDRLASWIEGSYHEPGSVPNLHCLRVFRSVRAPGGRVIAAVSVRHQKARLADAPEHYVVELWYLLHGPVETSDVQAACLGLASFRAWYARILEEAEVEGLRRRHRISVHANLVGTEVAPSDAVDLFSHHGGEVAFWTYRVRNGRAEFDPYYGEGEQGGASALAPMLDHLAWEFPEGYARASDGAGSDMPILPTTR